MTLEAVLADYQAKTTRSRALFEEAQQVLPGGNTRTTVFVDPYPFYAVRGTGPRAVVAAAREALERGLSFPAPSEPELRLAQELSGRVPSCAQVRFTNSGT